MTYEEFKGLVKDKVSLKCGGEYIVELTDVVKNNGERLSGLIIRKKDDNIVPIIYLEDYYNDFCDGMKIERIIEGILDVYSNNNTEITELPIKDLTDFSKIKGRIIFRLINYKMNREFLQDRPHRKFLDLAVVYCVHYGKMSLGNATTNVTNRLLEEWAVSENDLWEIAKVNTLKIKGCEILSMKEMIDVLTGRQIDLCDAENEIVEDVPQIRVLTNKDKIYGAASLLYDNLIEAFVKKEGCDFFVIPSSVHETLLIEKRNMSAEKIRAMVNEVNATLLAPQEVLSYNVYETVNGRLAIAA